MEIVEVRFVQHATLLGRARAQHLISLLFAAEGSITQVGRKLKQDNSFVPFDGNLSKEEIDKLDDEAKKTYALGDKHTPSFNPDANRNRRQSNSVTSKVREFVTANQGKYTPKEIASELAEQGLNYGTVYALVYTLSSPKYKYKFLKRDENSLVSLL